MLRAFGLASNAVEGSAGASTPSPLAHAVDLRAFDRAVDGPIEWTELPSALLGGLVVADGLSQEGLRARTHQANARTSPPAQVAAAVVLVVVTHSQRGSCTADLW